MTGFLKKLIALVHISKDSNFKGKSYFNSINKIFEKGVFSKGNDGFHI